ncbi:hypothetical protein niasHS_006008 [Heterodera schachtii]|uniref:Uncharacterized protein n=1 Tax=Heterodera schachtii TaxID=97005 RepID=A0ABD2K198_HETSC
MLCLRRVLSRGHPSIFSVTSVCRSTSNAPALVDSIVISPPTDSLQIFNSPDVQAMTRKQYYTGVWPRCPTRANNIEDRGISSEYDDTFVEMENKIGEVKRRMEGINKTKEDMEQLRRQMDHLQKQIGTMREMLAKKNQRVTRNLNESAQQIVQLANNLTERADKIRQGDNIKGAAEIVKESSRKAAEAERVIAQQLELIRKLLSSCCHCLLGVLGVTCHNEIFGRPCPPPCISTATLTTTVATPTTTSTMLTRCRRSRAGPDDVESQAPVAKIIVIMLSMFAGCAGCNVSCAAVDDAEAVLMDFV